MVLSTTVLEQAADRLRAAGYAVREPQAILVNGHVQFCSELAIEQVNEAVDEA